MEREYVIVFGKSRKTFHTKHHAEQFASALMMNGTPYTFLIDGKIYEEFEQ